MLLAKKANTVEHLPRSRARGFEALFQVRVFPFQTLHTLGIHPCAAGRGFELLHTSFSLKRATPESCELVSEMMDELLKLLECLNLRTFVV
jgi:hypothetical protein